MFRLLVLLCLLPTAIHAETRTEAAFTIRISGITVGSMSLSGVETGTAYSAATRIASAGAARVFRRFSYTGRASGSVTLGRFAPMQYEEVADTGTRQSESVLDYDGGVPRVTRYTSPRPFAPDRPAPASQGGTHDPLSALFAVMRDQPATGICNRTLTIYDGARRSRATLGPPRQVEGGVVCNGEFRRVLGYTPDELARHRVFPLQVRYRPGPGGLMQVVRVELSSVYGPATITRR